MRRLLLFVLLLQAAPAATQELLLTLDSPSFFSYTNMFGRALTAVPDVTGDGVDDLAVGAPEDRVDGVVVGLVYLFDGADGTLLHTLVSPTPEEDGFFGYALAAVSDADGDGVDDLLVGAPGERRAYVFSAVTGDLLRTTADPAAHPHSQFGYAAASLPDLDGDGRAEYAVGDPYTWYSEQSPGFAYVFRGSDGTLLHSLTTVGQTYTLNGGDDFASAVAAVPDTDGDGVADILVGAPGMSNGMGAVYLFSGESGARIWFHEEDFEEARGEHFGATLVGLEDTDGDGRGEFFATRPGWGHVPDSPWWTDLRGAMHFYHVTGEQQWVWSPNEEPYGQFASSAAGLGDIDGDGVSEVLVGARLEDPGESPENAGRAYIFSPPSDLRHVIVPPPGTPGREWRFGETVAPVPNVDGAGRKGFLVAAVGGPGERARVHLYTSETATLPLLTAAPVNPPIVIPPEGGDFSYTYTIESQSTNPLPQTWEVWTTALQPNGVETDPLSGPTPVTLAPGEVVSVTAEQHVIPSALPGEYVFNVYLGHYPLVDGGSASFTGTKAPSTAAEDGVEADGVVLHAPRPNPSASETVFAFDLPQPAQARLAVYDVLGREVAVLVEEPLPAGAHEAVLEGERLPRGTYLVRLTAGTHVATQRVTLVR